MERFSKLVKNVLGIDISNIFVIIAAIVILLIVVYLLAVLMYYLFNLNTFKKRLRNIEIEIRRNKGSTAEHWERTKRELYRDLFLLRL